MSNETLSDQAKCYARKVNYISTSTLQRKLLLGYKEASQILEMLINDGICDSKFTPNYGYLVLKKEGSDKWIP